MKRWLFEVEYEIVIRRKAIVEATIAKGARTQAAVYAGCETISGYVPGSFRITNTKRGAETTGHTPTELLASIDAYNEASGHTTV